MKESIKKVIKKIRFDIISLVVMVVSFYFLKSLGIIISPIFVLLYNVTSKEDHTIKNIMIIIYIILWILYACTVITSLWFFGAIFRYFLFYYVFVLFILLLIIDNRKIILSKKGTIAKN